MDDRNGTAGGPAPREGRVTFGPSLDGLRGIVTKGFLLSLVTFGLYRFWYTTDLRRFFWSRTVVDGSPAAYAGTGRELFLGFLVAVVVLIPIYVGLFVVAAFSGPFAGIWAFVGFALLFVLGAFALYRGRRYRASRTLWRGIRLGQDGSALSYAVRAAGWWILVIGTLGLAYPFMRASLERYRIRHTLVGTSRLESEARGIAVLRSWLVLWAIFVLPGLLPIGGMIAGGYCSPSTADMTLPDSGKIEDLDLFTALCGQEADPVTVALSAVLSFIISLGILIAPALYPYYRARETRAFVSAIRLGEIRLVSRLGVRDMYRPYFAYLIQSLKLAVLILLAVAALVTIVLVTLGYTETAVPFRDLAIAVGIVVVGGWYAIVSAILYVRVLKAGLWRAVAESTVISDADGLAAITASARRPGGALSEGLAEALDVGGALEIGF